MNCETQQQQQQKQQSSVRGGGGDSQASSCVPSVGLSAHIRTAAMLFVVTLVFMITFAPAFLVNK